MNANAYISLKEAAGLLDVTSATLRNWDRKGILKAIRHPVNDYRMYRLADVLKLQRQSSLFPVTSLDQALFDGQSSNEPLTASDVRRIVRSLHRALRDGEGNSSLIERFDELTKLLFCKIYEEKESNGESSPVFAVRQDDSDNSIANRVRSSFASQIKHTPDLFPAKFSKLSLSDKTIRHAVEILSPVTLSHVSEDLKGIAYEEVIRNTFEKGDNQQFFTPRCVVEFMVQLLGDFLSGTICDPACGTAGFLLYAESFLRSCKKRLRTELVGLEIDDRLSWVAGINLKMHGATNFRIEHLAGAGSLGTAVKLKFGTIDVILTNPPFGSDMTDEKALNEMELGFGRQSRRRGVLFIERCLDLLRPGGVVGIIIDEGVLNGPTNKDVRRLILERSDLFAVVSLPETTFMPYASVKASIVFLQKKGGRKPRAMRNEQTFFASAEVVGRKPNGEPLLRVNQETGRQELHTDLPEILNIWNGGTPSLSIDRGFWSKLPGIQDAIFQDDGLRLDLAYHHPSRQEATNALQNSPFPLRHLADLCEIRNESVVPSKDLVDEDITYVGLANIEAHTGNCSPTVVPGVTLKSSVKRFQANDILFSKMRPELRKISLIPGDVSEGFASSECIVLIPRKESLDGDLVMLPELLSLLLRSDLVYGQIVHQVIGIGRPRLSKAAVLNVRIPVPSIKDQRRLLELYNRSEKAALALFVESQEALRKSEVIISDARRQLLNDLLSNCTVDGSQK
jgi:type I restriction enzyme M protein